MSLSCNCNKNIIHIRVAKVELFEVVKANAITFARVCEKIGLQLFANKKLTVETVVDSMSA